jgi:hypothetical protein
VEHKGWDPIVVSVLYDDHECTYHLLLWYKRDFNPAIKCDYVTNNIAESFNNWIKGIKDLPMCELADKIREKIMELFYRRQRISRMLQGKILSAVLRVQK